MKCENSRTQFKCTVNLTAKLRKIYSSDLLTSATVNSSIPDYQILATCYCLLMLTSLSILHLKDYENLRPILPVDALPAN